MSLLKKRVHHDIDVAKALLRHPLTAHAAHRMLEPHLGPDEAVVAMALGNASGARGLVVLTDQRVLVVQERSKDDPGGGFPLDSGTTATWTRRGNQATVTVRREGACAQLRRVPISDATRVVSAVQARCAASGLPAPRDAPAQP